MTTPCLEYTIISRDGTQAIVEFKNPYFENLTEEQEVTEMVDGEEVTTTKTVVVDPNRHVTKTLNIPLNIDGSLDKVTWMEILCGQAMGVKHRMDNAYASQNRTVSDDLDSQLGL